MIDLREVIDLEILLVFAKYTILLLVKMMLMSLITGLYRMKKKAFSSPEDASAFGGKGENAKKYLRTDPDVERVRRCHLNDLENILPFIFIGLFYSLTGVSLATATLHYQIFFASRVFHTISYLIPLPQPCRGLAWFTGYLVTFSMIYKLFLHTVQIK